MGFLIKTLKCLNKIQSIYFIYILSIQLYLNESSPNFKSIYENLHYSFYFMCGHVQKFKLPINYFIKKTNAQCILNQFYLFFSQTTPVYKISRYPKKSVHYLPSSPPLGSI